MQTKTKNVYYCEHCKKNGLVKWMIEKHERFCSSNPVNFSRCCNCVHVISETIDIDYSNGGDENYTRTSSAFKCAVKKCGLIPLVARRKGLPERYPDTFLGAIPMPSACWEFEEIDFLKL